MLKSATVAAFAIIITLSVSRYVCAKELPSIKGYGLLGMPNIPGSTNDERWRLVGSKLSQLCKAKRDEVYEVLGVASRTMENQDRSPTWFFRITSNESLSPFEDEFHQLRIKFDGDAVMAVEVCLVKEPASPVISK
jgi:hypothetical protein